MSYLTSRLASVSLVCRTDECPHEGDFEPVRAEFFTGRWFHDTDPICPGCGEIRELVE